MQIFLKRILSQEWGYSGNIPNQRGKYLLVPEICRSFFPPLSSGIRNSFTSLRILLPSGSWVGTFFVWNNTKFFPEVGLARAHNETRWYSNKIINEELQLDRDVILCLCKLNGRDSDYYLTSIHPSSSEYISICKILDKKSALVIDSESLENTAPILFENIKTEMRSLVVADEESQNSIINSYEALEIARDLLLQAASYLGPSVEIHGDPLTALASNFKTQRDFSDAVRSVYNGRCALRNTFIYENHPIGLEAAHVHAKAQGGNFLPSNGILLSIDLHRAFDEGIWTLTDDLKVQLHPAITSGIMLEFDGKALCIPQDNLAFKPFQPYLKWHREQRFGLFTRHESS
jgi:hypothetical protein